MKRVIVLSFLAALGAAPVLALNPTPASAFSGWCSGYGAPRGVIAPRARVYRLTARSRGYRPVYRSRVVALGAFALVCGGGSHSSQDEMASGSRTLRACRQRSVTARDRAG